MRSIEACGYAGSKATIPAYRAKGYDAVPVRGADAALTVAGAIGGWMLALELSKALGGRIPVKDLVSQAETLAREGVRSASPRGATS